MSYTYPKLRGRIVEKFGTIEAFAERINTSSVTVSKKLNGKTQFSQADIVKWGAVLNIDRKDFGAYFFAEKA